ncbi:Transcriptional regulator WhiB [Mycobacterium bohemicum DSM 44277]|uniref:Transcriptional regulator WhiB n=1 Tax=Mycobacterium bohemicum DSM 44277 TaxID=1236609 RepID=A0A0U0WBQ6_MYCBE|nr:WhiB family transcriptional regulator [Mycobacterium bohemicum]MCV6968866.1 WhiB family transcriptional regulator [Mycobacterium bohemicum]CPR12430.1 Transcriptional regulator WhiB [Mycobacterium bohemicum DSM 44277]
MITHHQPRPLTATRLVGVTQLTAVVGDIPPLPGAACKGQPTLFDLEPGADTAAIEAAAAVCRSCPALQACAEWVASTPPRRRPSGVVAGQLLPAPEPPPEPDTTTATGRATVFLTERLHDGPRLVADLITEAAAVGLTRGHLGEAARRLRVTRTRSQHRKFTWALSTPA